MKKIITTFVTMFLLGAMAHSQVNINGATINAQNGYRYQGTAPNNTILCGNGSFFIPSSTCGASATLYYQTVQLSGSSLPQRSFLNFTNNFNVGDSGGTNTLVDLASTIGSNTTGNAATATNLQGSPSQCSGGNVATGINSNGNANCTNTVTQANQLTSTPSQCSSGQFSTGIAANGNANCSPAVGGGYTLSDDTSSRFFGGAYQNGGSTFMDVYVRENQISGVGNNSLLTCYLGPNSGSLTGVMSTGVTNSGGKTGCYVHVPPGWWYSANAVITGGSPTLVLDAWYEGQ